MDKQIWFADFHQASLAFSLRLLAKRLNAQIFFPIGEDWANKRIWLIHKPYNYSKDTVKQYLGIDHRYKPIDGTPALHPHLQKKWDHFTSVDSVTGDTIKYLSFSQFIKYPIDIIIASIPDHWETFTKLAKAYKPEAKVICQMGNMFNEVNSYIENGTIKNLMSSTIPFELPVNINKIFYHQEFPLEIFKRQPIHNNKNIYSFVNCFQISELFKEDEQIFKNVEKKMADWSFKSYGASNRDGFVSGLAELADKMNESTFVWHTKRGGDGYGHIVLNAAFLGKPLITKNTYYQNKLGGKFMQDGFNAVCIDNLSIDQIVNKITYYSTEEHYKVLSDNLYRTAIETVNFDNEEHLLRNFFNNLQ